MPCCASECWAFRGTARHNKTVITYNSTRPTTIRLPEYWQNYNISIPAYLKGHIQHMCSWWWVELSPETCRVKPLRRIKAIVASCWIYFTIQIWFIIRQLVYDLWMKYFIHLFTNWFKKDVAVLSVTENISSQTPSTPTHCHVWQTRVLHTASIVSWPRYVHTFTCQKLWVSKHDAKSQTTSTCKTPSFGFSADGVKRYFFYNFLSKNFDMTYLAVCCA